MLSKVTAAATGSSEVSEAELRAARQQGHERTEAGQEQQRKAKYARQQCKRAEKAEAQGGGGPEGGGDKG